MNSNLAFYFSCVTEAAALAAYEFIGRADKNAADAAAVKAMRTALDDMPMRGKIVIGEGEIDEAPMLYIGETLGQGAGLVNLGVNENQINLDTNEDIDVDIAVDPIDGTRMTALGQNGAVSVLAASKKGGLLHAPDMYMEKLIVGEPGKDLMDLNLPLLNNVKVLAKVLDKKISQMSIAILDKPRHQEIIHQLRALGVKVFTPVDGDVLVSLFTSIPLDSVSEHPIDMMYGIGGAPEGVISAAAIRALGGEMQARLVPRSDVRGISSESQKIDALERERCQAMGVNIGRILTLDELVSCDDVIFSMTGITHCELLDGVVKTAADTTTQTLLIHSKNSKEVSDKQKSRKQTSVRRIHTKHNVC